MAKPQKKSKKPTKNGLIGKFGRRTTTIRIADTLKGKIGVSGSKILIPFNTSQSELDPGWENVPRHASLIFLMDRKGDYVFSGVQMICHCEDCSKKR